MGPPPSLESLVAGDGDRIRVGVAANRATSRGPTRPEYPSTMGETYDQAALDREYWTTDRPMAAIQQAFGLKKPVHCYITPLQIPQRPCPGCSAQMAYRSRTARAANDAHCPTCGHQDTRGCQCARCASEREASRMAEGQRRAQAAQAEFEAAARQATAPEYVAWALEKTQRRDREFLRAFIVEVTTNSSATWESICKRAGVVNQEQYVDRLVALRLLFRSPQGAVSRNPSVNPDDLVLPTVRQISKGTRFQVFQRDEFTCQYCGRKSPDVQLVMTICFPSQKAGRTTSKTSSRAATPATRESPTESSRTGSAWTAISGERSSDRSATSSSSGVVCTRRMSSSTG